MDDGIRCSARHIDDMVSEPTFIYEYQKQELTFRLGDIIRIAPNELSFVSVQAYKDIYGPPSKTRKLFRKSPMFYDTGIQSIVYEMDPDEHEKQHKLFAPAFRASAVRSQEHVVQEHVDLFVTQLRDQGQSGQVALDVSAWMEWLAFDVIGE